MKNQFNLGYTKLFSCDMGELIPCGLLEVLPGDVIEMATSALVRAQALLAPVMHPVEVKIHHWFVPNRLVWVDFEKFITGGPDGLDASVFPTLTIPGGGFAVGSLHDYFGVPTGVGAAQLISALPARGYARIWNEWYRDQDLQTPLNVSTASGADVTTSVALQNICWEKDYYTSARPWEQKGAAITIPLGTSAPTVAMEGASVRNLERTSASAATQVSVEQAGGGAGTNFTFLTDLSLASGISVNTLRASLALQRFQEARARYGSRYVEYLRAMGVRSSDARLDRPEYLGGGKQTIQFSEVVATAETGTSVDVGDLKGHGIAALRSNKFRTFFEEHGYIHTFMSVKPKTIYANGLFRHWNRRIKTDFWQPELQHIGQQAIKMKEIYLPAASPENTFGWQDRYDEYRRSESFIGGEFRSTVLDFWHMARILASEPALNATFVSSVPTERSFAVPANDVLMVHTNHNIRAKRLVSPIGNSFTE
ncbi:MAG: major capsid protein [Microvirus sp.]|nr:MAG: major capsid protein [Microvirus sp.]